MPSFPARFFSKVSRAIGDIYLKFLEFSNLYKQFGSSDSLLKAVITAEASISVRKLERDDLFFILASNGVWEQLGDQTAVDNNVHEPGRGFAKRLARTEAPKNTISFSFARIVVSLSKIQSSTKQSSYPDLAVCAKGREEMKLSKIWLLDRKPSKCVLFNFEDDPRGVIAAHNYTMMAIPCLATT